MYVKKLLSVILLISLALLSGCAGMNGSEIKEQRAGTDKDDAIPVYEGYIGENPDSVKSRSKLGVWYLKTGRLKEAIAEFETTLKKEPGEPFATYYLGLAYLNMEDFEKAIQVWEGYRNRNKPLIEEEIGRQLTLLRIAHSRKFAAKALAEEKKIMAVEPDADTVAVCYYQDLSPDKSLRAFQKGLTAMVISDLTRKNFSISRHLPLGIIAGIMRISLTDEERKAIGVPHTKVYKALVFFGSALDALDAGKWKEANDNLSMALKEDPLFDLAQRAAYTCTGADYPDISAVLKMPAVMVSAKIEAKVSVSEGTLIKVDQPVAGVPPVNGYTGVDILGVDVGAIGISG